MADIPQLHPKWTIRKRFRWLEPEKMSVTVPTAAQRKWRGVAHLVRGVPVQIEWLGNKVVEILFRLLKVAISIT